MIRLAALAALAAIIAAGPVRADDPARTMVYDLIASRLALMKPIAAWKYAQGAPVEDLEREARVLDKSAEDARIAGIDPAAIRPFFQAQIDAAKAIQHCWISRWTTGEAVPPADPPDLDGDLRPRLLAIGLALVQSIEAALAEGVDFDPERSADFARSVDLDCLDDAARDAILAGLGELRLAR